MKKALFVVLSVFVLFALVSCKNPELPTAGIGTPNLSNIEFAKYDAFAVMRESNGSRGLSDSINGEINRLFGLADNVLEKIIITDDKGLEWACNEVSNLGKDFLLMGLSCTHSAGPTVYKNYIVDRLHNKVIDLSFLDGDTEYGIKNINLQANAEGLFAKKDFTVVKIDSETKTLTPLTNPDVDKVDVFYRFDNGAMLVYESGPKAKFFTPSNVAPIDYTGDIFNAHIIYSIRQNNAHNFLTRPDLDFIVDLENEGYYTVTSEGLEFDSLKEKHGYKEGHSEYSVIYPKEHTLLSTKVVRYYYYQGLVIVYDISSGALQSLEYKAPAPYNIKKDMFSYNNGHLIYSTSSGLYSLDLEAQTTETLVEGILAKWQMTTGGVIYTKYLSATDVETCFLNLATKETEKLSSSGVEVVSIASFVE